MKILLINNIHYIRGGSERIYFETANLLKEAGYEVIFFSTKNEKNIKTEFKEYFVDDLDYSNVKSNKLFKNIKMLFHSLYSFKVRRALEEVLKKEKPDIAHIQNIYFWISPSILSLFKKYNVKVVQTLHDYHLMCPNFKFLSHDKICEKCANRKFYNCTKNKCIKNSYIYSLASTIEAYFVNGFDFYRKYVDIFIAPSDFLRNKYIDIGKIDKNKIVTIKNFVDLESNINKEQELDNYILFFGRLAEGKGIDLLIKSMKYVNNDIKLKIVGDGNYKDNLKQLCNSLGLESRIEFTGYKEGDELNNIINKARIVLVPSIWYENCPMVILESFSRKKFVIATDIGAIPEFVKDNTTGVLFKLNDEKDLALKINENYYDKDKIKNIGENAYNYVKIYHNKQYYLDNILKIYNKLSNENI
ncbi:MAG TPA: glycosyltransferase family 4 protein [bacterium]|nr:glycosyltransferase family 4 protein [bacterium]